VGTNPANVNASLFSINAHAHLHRRSRLLVVGSSSRTSSGDGPPRGEQATTQLLSFFRRSLPPTTHGHLRGRSSGNFTGIGTGRGHLRKPVGVSGAPGDRRGRVDFSPSSRRDLRDPPPNHAESSQGDVRGSQRMRHGRTRASNSDDDDSDLGVPLGSTTPTLTSARGYGNAPRRYRSLQEPYSSSPETAENDYQQRNLRLGTDVRGLRRGYESDDEEDYGQVVVSFLTLRRMKPYNLVLSFQQR